MWYKYRMEYYPTFKKRKSYYFQHLAAVKWNKPEKDNYYMVSFICRILNKKKKRKLKLIEAQ